MTTIDDTRKNADRLAEKALMRTTFAEMKSSLSQSNVLKRAAKEKQEKLDKHLEKKKVLLEKKEQGFELICFIVCFFLVFLVAFLTFRDKFKSFGRYFKLLF